MAFGRELPEDLVADVLRRLPPRSLAVSQCVCRAWRDLVDARRLLRADLLPRSVGGILANFLTVHSPEFLVRPATRASISGDFEITPGFSKVEDHCNGLVLCTETSGDRDYVSNPATRRRAWLPQLPQSCSQMREKGFHQIKCLVYDPTLSPHYDVFLIHSLKQDRHKSVLKPGQMMQCEGSVSSCPLQVYVYSSETRRWEERWFAPEGCVVETTIDDDKKVYWRGALYLLCENRFVMRISISNAKFRLIPTPSDVEFMYHAGSFSLGRSEKGVYCAFRYDSQLHIFFLNESCGQMVWELRHSVDFTNFAQKLHAREDYYDQQNGPCILQDVNYYKYPYGNDNLKKLVDDNFEWNSDDDNVLNSQDMAEGYAEGGYTGLLGFHPYKEIVFLNAAWSRAVAYHWSTSKFQDMGSICPKDYRQLAGHVVGIHTSFIYTPCLMEDFPENSSPIEDKHNVYI